MSTYNVTNKIHVWVGMSSKSKQEFSRYFDVNPVDCSTPQKLDRLSGLA